MKNGFKIFVLLMLLQLACTKKIDLKIDDKADLPVLNFIISNRPDVYDENVAILTKTNFILKSNKKFDSISGAQFNFYKDESEFGIIKEISPTKGSYYLTDKNSNQINLLPNNKYRVIANVPGFQTLSAETYIPPLTNFTIPEIIQDSLYFNLKLNISDDDPEFNYYLFNMTITIANPFDTNQKVQSSNFFIPREIQNLRDNGNRGGLIDIIGSGNTLDFIVSESDLNGFNSSVTFNSGDFSFNEISLGGFPNPKTKFANFKVYKLSKDLYQYLKSSRRQFEVGDNPFSEPTFVYTNIKNGLGIFAGYSVTPYK